MMLRFLIFFPLLFLVSACVSYETISDGEAQVANRRTLRRATCVSFDIPSVTLTTESTAMERQLLGENIELEADGWMIGSSQSSVSYAYSKVKSSGSGDASLALRRYYVELGVLHYYEKKVSDYLHLQILGEGYDGKLRVVPLAISNKGRKEQRSIARKVVFAVNRAREWIYHYQLAQAIQVEGGGPTTKKQIREQVQSKYLYSYFTQARLRVEEWIYKKEGEWSLTTTIGP